jgi:natural product biosynthesis luciferase-like monooxygenase protein
VRCVVLDAEADALLQLTAARPNVHVLPQQLAYLIYTSGSTGKPKGVMIEHRQVVNFFVGMDERVAHDPAGSWLAVTSLSFDISVLELWWTLAHGFKVVVHADRVRTGAAGRGQEDAKTRSGGEASARPVEFSLFYFSADAQAQGSARYQLLLEGAKFADTHGFSAVWTPERHFHAFGGLYPNPAVTGAAVAAITTRVGIRAGSVVLPLHHPARVAEQWAVVDNISNGRVGISVASGWQPNDFVLMPENYKNAKSIMLRDLDVVRKLWRGETVEFPGPLGKPVPVRTLPEPVQKELPVWITTAGNEETFALAGSAGANVLTHLLGQSLDKLAPKIAAYRKARAAAGFDPSTGIVSLMLHTFVGPDRERVKDAVRAPLKAYLGTSMDLIKDKAWTFPAFKRPKGFKADEPGNELATLSEEDREALLDAAFERYFETSGLFGTVDEALQTVQAVKSIGVDDVACLIDFGVPTSLVLEHLPYVNAVREAELTARKPALLAGSAEEEEHALLRDVRTHGVTHLQCTPSMARMFLGHEETREALGQLQHIFLGGEALPADLLSELRSQTRATITNMYGPTETTVWSTTHRVGETETSVSIGTPIANTSLYVTDEQRRLLPAGVPGELWIGGLGVARGYWEREELTAERFVNDPFSSFSTTQPARMYRTGDRARWRHGDNGIGTMEYLGRADFQVKLRGYRIEPGEIEALARKAPEVAECVVVLREDRPGDAKLVGYLVPAPGAKLSVDAVRDRLRAELPEHMVPSAFVLLEALPLTPNRKIDRKALPAPDAAKAPAADGGGNGASAAPENEVQQVLASVWQEMLGRDRVGIDDNFFDLGGHSLLVVRMHRKLQDELNRPLALTDLYRFPTIRSFATFLAEGGSGDSKKAAARGAKRREMLQRRGG